VPDIHVVSDNIVKEQIKLLPIVKKYIENRCLSRLRAILPAILILKQQSAGTQRKIATCAISLVQIF